MEAEEIQPLMTSQDERPFTLTSDDPEELEDFLRAQGELDQAVLDQLLAQICADKYIKGIHVMLMNGANPLSSVENDSGDSILDVSRYSGNFEVMLILLRHVSENGMMDRKTVSGLLQSAYSTVGSYSFVRGAVYLPATDNTETLLYLMRTIDETVPKLDCVQRNHDGNNPRKRILDIWTNIFLKDSTEKWTLYCNSETCKNGSGSQPYFRVHNFQIADLPSLIFGMGENGFGLHRYTVEDMFSEDFPSDWTQYTLSIQNLCGMDNFTPVKNAGVEIVPSPLESIALLALVTGRFHLAEMFLRMHQFDIVPMALLMRLVALRLAKQKLPSKTKDRLRDFSETMENIAVDTLHHVCAEDCESKEIYTYLQRPLITFGCKSLLHLAKKAQCTTYFFSRSYCDEIWRNRWNGCLARSSTLQLWLTTFLPLFVIMLGRSTNYFNNLELLRAKSILFQWSEIRSTPCVKYLFHSMCHFLFLLLFSYVVLLDFHFKPTGWEIICALYVVGYAVEELLQVRLFVQMKNIKTYFTDFWNWVDLTAVIVTLLGFIVRCWRISMAPETAELEAHETVLYASRVMLSVGLVSFYVRILYIFSISENLGPKLTMIGTILKKDVIPLLKIFLIFIIAFGVSFQTILYPNGYPIDPSRNSTGLGSGDVILNLFRRAFYGMFGPDYPFDELECSEGKNCPSNIGNKLFMYGYQVVYVIIVHVLLLNVLIALLSNTVSNIDEQSRDIWIAEKYHLVEEYNTRSLFPPPFNLICIPIEAIFRRYMHSVNKSWLHQAPSTSMDIRIILPYLLIQTFALEGKRYKLGKETQMDKQEDAFIRTEQISKQMHEMSHRLDKVDQILERLDRNVENIMQRLHNVPPQ